MIKLSVILLAVRKSSNKHHYMKIPRFKNWVDDDKLLLQNGWPRNYVNPLRPTLQNGQHTQTVWVCLTILWGWRLNVWALLPAGTIAEIFHQSKRLSHREHGSNLSRTCIQTLLYEVVVTITPRHYNDLFYNDLLVLVKVKQNEDRFG